MSSKHLVEEVVGQHPIHGNYYLERHYEQLSQLYVVANRYEQEHIYWRAH